MSDPRETLKKLIEKTELVVSRNDTLPPGYLKIISDAKSKLSGSVLNMTSAITKLHHLQSQIGELNQKTVIIEEPTYVYEKSGNDVTDLSGSVSELEAKIAAKDVVIAAKDTEIATKDDELAEVSKVLDLAKTKFKTIWNSVKKTQKKFKDSAGNAKEIRHILTPVRDALELKSKPDGNENILGGSPGDYDDSPDDDNSIDSTPDMEEVERDNYMAEHEQKISDSEKGMLLASTVGGAIYGGCKLSHVLCVVCILLVMILLYVVYYPCGSSPLSSSSRLYSGGSSGLYSGRSRFR